MNILWINLVRWINNGLIIFNSIAYLIYRLFLFYDKFIDLITWSIFYVVLNIYWLCLIVLDINYFYLILLPIHNSLSICLLIFLNPNLLVYLVDYTSTLANLAIYLIILVLDRVQIVFIHGNLCGIFLDCVSLFLIYRLIWFGLLVIYIVGLVCLSIVKEW